MRIEFEKLSRLSSVDVIHSRYKVLYLLMFTRILQSMMSLRVEHSTTEWCSLSGKPCSFDSTRLPQSSIKLTIVFILSSNHFLPLDQGILMTNVARFLSVVVLRLVCVVIHGHLRAVAVALVTALVVVFLMSRRVVRLFVGIVEGTLLAVVLTGGTGLLGLDVVLVVNLLFIVVVGFFVTVGFGGSVRLGVVRGVIRGVVRGVIRGVVLVGDLAP